MENSNVSLRYSTRRYFIKLSYRYQPFYMTGYHVKTKLKPKISVRPKVTEHVRVNPG